MLISLGCLLNVCFGFLLYGEGLLCSCFSLTFCACFDVGLRRFGVYLIGWLIAFYDGCLCFVFLVLFCCVSFGWVL